jgi:putative membrane protein insertion efficiency factor
MDARSAAGTPGRIRNGVPGRAAALKPAIRSVFPPESRGVQPFRLQRKKAIGRRGGAQPDSPAHPRNRKAESLGDTCRMGHCDSSARLSGASGVFTAGHGADGTAEKLVGVKTATPAARLLLLFIRAYQASLSPLMSSPCKFYPSCSRYAYEAIELHGARRGAWLALKRLSRCRPFSKGGVDFVPERSNSSQPHGLKEIAQ